MAPRALLMVPVLFLVAGCTGESPTGTSEVSSPIVEVTGKPSPNSASGFFPLAIGNRWEFDRVIDLEFFPDGNATPPWELDFPLVARATREVIGDVDSGGQSYRVIRYTVFEDEYPDSPFISFEYHRQDKDGLYFTYPPEPERPGFALARGTGEVAGSWSAPLSGRYTAEQEAAIHSLVAKREAFHRSMRSAVAKSTEALPNEASPAEWVALQYPLHNGQEWIMRPENDPFLITRSVERVEVLDLPFGRVPAYRIKHDLHEIFGPNDFAYFWYGKDGYYGYRLHIESDWTDSSGNRLGTYVGEESEMLTGLHLEKHGAQSARSE